MTNYARIIRRAAIPTAAVAALMVAVSAAIGGPAGLVGALLGVALVAAFFGIDVVVIGRAARVSPQAMMLAAILTYVAKILGLAGVMLGLDGTTAFDTRLFGVTAIVCIIVWCAGQVLASMTVKTPYVTPDGERSTSGDGTFGGRYAEPDRKR